MTRRLAGGVLVILTVFAAGFIAQRLFGSGPDPMTEAREAVESLPYRVSTHAASEDVLVGTARGHLGDVVHFAVADSREAEGIPLRLQDEAETGGGGGFFVWEDRGRHRPGESEAAARERAEISVDIEEALCRKETGEACPI
jgi:hypothetical protein